MANLTATGKTRRRLEPGGYAGDGPSVDYASVFGVVGAFTVIGLAMYLGGSPGRFIDLPAILIVLGGTFLVTTISFTVEEVVRAHIVMLRAILYHAEAYSAFWSCPDDDLRCSVDASLHRCEPSWPESMALLVGVGVVGYGVEFHVYQCNPDGDFCLSPG